MSEWLQSVGGYLGMALVPAIPISCVLYLVLAGVRRSGVDRSTPDYARSSVRFHGGWGLVLSLPLVIGGANVSFGANGDWKGLLLLMAALGCWAVAIAAMLGRRIPALLTWLPLALTTVTLLALPSGSDSFARLHVLVRLVLAGGDRTRRLGTCLR